ncbi:MAG: hypothetical protein AAF637_26415, partial [Pseudomonadota bacterium]
MVVVARLDGADGCRRPLVLVERVHQREAGGQLFVQDAGAGQLTLAHKRRLGAHERRRQHNLIA